MCNLTDRVRLVTLGMLATGLLVLALGVARLPAAGLAELFAAGPGSVLQHDAHAAFDADDPVLAALEGAFREQGIAGALRQLSALSAAQPDLRPLEHHYVFEVARLSYAQTQDAAESFRQCGAVADTGCYHGVMDAFVAATPWLARDDIAQLCDGAPVTARTPVLRIQCVHGVGHGLARVAGDRLLHALAACDGFRSAQDRDACYSGVFMQVIEETDARPDIDPFVLDPSRQVPFAMCRPLAERYQRTCYLQQPTVLLAANGEDVPAAFAACEQAPAPYVVPCSQGVGGWISIYTHWDPGQTGALCQLAAIPFRPWCLDGAVAAMATVHAAAARPMALCRNVAPDLRTFCFEAIGERIPALYADRSDQERACNLAQDQAWIQICRRSAGLPAGSRDR